MLFLAGPGGALRLLVRRDWRNIVRIDDLEYISDLMGDFQERAQNAPDALFRQVASLSVGPLLTYAVGSDSELRTQESLVDVRENMVEL